MSSSALVANPTLEDSALSPVSFEGSRRPHCSPEAILIYLTVPGSPVIPMKVLESDSIASVKLRIQSFKGFVAGKQTLMSNGRELARNDSLVRDYGLSDGNVLQLETRLSDLRSITIKTTCGKKYEFQVESRRNIGYVKRQVAEGGWALGNLEDHKLVCDGEEIGDDQIIDDICKNNDAVFHLVIPQSAKIRSKPVEKDNELVVVASDWKKKKGIDDLQMVAGKPRHRDCWIQQNIIDPKVEHSPAIMELVRSTSAGMEKGNPPILSTEGCGGVYFMQDALGHRCIGVFKPIDEEPMAENNPRGLQLSTNGEGMKRGTRVGEGAMREVAAYVLDHPLGGRRISEEAGFAGVPPTVMVGCLNRGFHRSEEDNGAGKTVKVGSLQMFVENCGSCEDMGPQAFPVGEVQKIAVLDIRLANADRHAGNILVCKDNKGRIMLVPIDHAYCLPDRFEDCTFDWLYWRQARQHFSGETIAYIKSLDAEEDIALLKSYGWELSPESSRTLRISTMLLKKGVQRGLTPYDIGSIMCRVTTEKESKIEEIIREAGNAILPRSRETAFLECVSEIMDRHLDKLLS
ncbi:unnamed protein product [Musa hybrid cultivar]